MVAATAKKDDSTKTKRKSVKSDTFKKYSQDTTDGFDDDIDEIKKVKLIYIKEEKTQSNI